MKRFCTGCGKEIAADTTFCDSCGTPIGDVTSAESTETSQHLDASVGLDPKRRSGRGRWLFLIAGAATLVIAIASGGVWWLGFAQFDKDKAANANKSFETAAKGDSSGSIFDRLASIFSAGSADSVVASKTWVDMPDLREKLREKCTRELLANLNLDLGTSGFMCELRCEGPMFQAACKDRDPRQLPSDMQHYETVRAKTSIAISAAAGMKTPVYEYWRDNKRFPATLHDLNAQSLGNDSFQVILEPGGRIVVQFRMSEIPELGGRRIFQTPVEYGETLAWKCDSPDISPRYLIPRCLDATEEARSDKDKTATAKKSSETAAKSDGSRSIVDRLASVFSTGSSHSVIGKWQFDANASSPDILGDKHTVEFLKDGKLLVAGMDTGTLWNIDKDRMKLQIQGGSMADGGRVYTYRIEGDRLTLNIGKNVSVYKRTPS